MRIRQRTAGYVSLRKHISACLLLLEVVLVLGELMWLWLLLLVMHSRIRRRTCIKALLRLY